MKEIKINTLFIRLDQLLKFSNIANSGGDAKNLILNEMVLVNGEVATQRGKKIFVNNIVEIKNGQKIKVIGEQ